MTRERLARAGLISLIGGATGAVFGLILAIVVGRGLGVQGAGFFFQTVALFMIVANVLELGADTGLVRELSRQVSLGRYADLRRTVLIAVVPVLTVGVVMVAVLCLGAPVLAGLISAPSARATTEGLIVHTMPFVVLASLVTVLLGGTRGLGSVLPFVSVYNVGLPVARVLLVLAALAAGFELFGVAQAWVIPSVLAAAVAAVVLVRQLTLMPFEQAVPAAPRTPVRLLAREFWSFSAPRGLAAALEIVLAWLDVLLVGALLGPAAAGIYAVASRCVRAGLLVDTAMRMAVSARISATLAVGDLERARNLLRRTTQSMILLSWPLYATLACFAPVVLDVFGAGFEAGTTTVELLCAAMMLLSGAGMVQTVLLMGGRSRWQLNNKVVALVVNIAANVVLMPVLGIAGAAVAWVLTVAVDTALATWQVQHRMAVRVSARALAAPVAVVLVTVVVPGVLVRVVLGATAVALAVHLVVAAILFTGACLVFRSRLGVGGLATMLPRSRVAPTTRGPAGRR